MKFGPNHISMIGVGVSAVAAIAMVLYYRNQATQAAASADTGAGMGAFPYFQTAAIPSSVGGGSTMSTSAPAAAPALDVNALVAQSSMTSFLEQITGQQSAQLAAIPGGGSTPVFSAGYIGPNASGGISFSSISSPAAALPFLYPAIGADLSKAGNPFSSFAPTGSLTPSPGSSIYTSNSTNSTPPPATIVH